MLSFATVTKWTPASLFRSRVARYARFQWRALRSVVDWTVALYIALPAAGFGLYQYISWWKEIPAWLQPAIFVLDAHPLVPLLLLFLLAGRAVIRTFVEEADRLHIQRSEEWYGGLRRRGMAYTLLASACWVALLLVLAAPLLVRGLDWSLPQCAWLFAVLAPVKLLLGLAIDWTRLRLKGWRRRMAEAGIYAGGAAAAAAAYALGAAGPFPALLAFAALLGLLAPAIRARLAQPGAFAYEVGVERDARLRLAAALLQAAGSVSPGSRSRSGPWLFRRSQRLFRRRTAGHALAEFAVKAFFRSGTQLRLYVQFTAVGTFAVWYVPGFLKWAVWPVLLLLLALWMKQYAKEVWACGYLKLLPATPEMKYSALPTALFALSTPAALWISLMAGLSIGAGIGGAAGALAGAVVCPAAGLGLAYAASALLSISYG